MESPRRSFLKELLQLIGETVTVFTDSGEIEGVLLGVDTDSMSVCLANAMTERGKFYRLVVPGGSIRSIAKVEASLNMKRLYDEIKKTFDPELVEYDQSKGEIRVFQGRVIVTRRGVIAEKKDRVYEMVKKIYDKFVEESERS
ncbi:MAG: hypothetical protein DRN99_00930 [Thermoproteota archaeon]|nr:MAG: hypothetical protein DRN99_00930 [Candidatus Korarchaeota archaeon]